jgi:DNA processing protein
MARPTLVEIDTESLAYPRRLFALADPPERLCIAGSLAALADRPVIGIVGSRQASVEGCERARRWARSFAEAGALVISGGALGIDAAAHRGAIDAGAPTICVLPTPLTAPGPRRNWRVFHDAIDHGGAWIHELDAGPARVPFMRRNRLIAALADLILVIEARAESGTRHTVAAASQLMRPVYFSAWPPFDPRSEGQRAKWGQSGAVVSSPEPIANALGIGVRPKATDPLLALLANGPLAPATIAARLGRSASEVLVALSRLELAGVVDQRAGRYWTK